MHINNLGIKIIRTILRTPFKNVKKAFKNDDLRSIRGLIGLLKKVAYKRF